MSDDIAVVLIDTLRVENNQVIKTKLDSISSGRLVDFFDKSKNIHTVIENNLSSMDAHINGNNELNLDDNKAKYMTAVVQVNAQKIANLISELPTQGNEEELYAVVKILARLRVKQIMDELPSEERYKDARIVDPVSWINTIIKPRLDTTLHAALYDLWVYNIEEHKEFYRVIQPLRAKAAKKIRITGKVSNKGNNTALEKIRPLFTS